MRSHGQQMGGREPGQVDWKSSAVGPVEKPATTPLPRLANCAAGRCSYREDHDPNVPGAMKIEARAARKIAGRFEAGVADERVLPAWAVETASKRPPNIRKTKGPAFFAANSPNKQMKRSELSRRYEPLLPRPLDTIVPVVGCGPRRCDNAVTFRCTDRRSEGRCPTRPPGRRDNMHDGY